MCLVSVCSAQVQIAGLGDLVLWLSTVCHAPQSPCSTPALAENSGFSLAGHLGSDTLGVSRRLFVAVCVTHCVSWSFFPCELLRRTLFSALVSAQPSQQRLGGL